VQVDQRVLPWIAIEPELTVAHLLEGVSFFQAEVELLPWAARQELLEQLKRRGEAILAAIADGRQAPPIPRDEGRGRSESGDAPLIALSEALLRARALQAGLAYELIASRSELEQIVAAARRSEPEPEVRTLSGWRRELVGDDLRDVLAGNRAVAVGENRRLELRPSPSRA